MAFKGYKRSIQLGFDYNEVKEGIPNVKKQMAVLNAEFKKSSEEAKVSGKEIDNLGVKYDFLSNKLKIQEKEVDNYRKQLEKAQSAQGNNAKAVQNATTALEIAEAKLGQTRAQLEQVTKELEKNKTVLGKTSEEWKTLGDKTHEIGQSMTTKLTLPILAAAAASFKLGADMEDALGKVGVVFKGSEKDVEQWASTSLKSFGLAKGTALEMVGFFGGMANSMGLTAEKSLDMSKSLTELTMDLATFSNAKVDVVNTALTSVFTGETESLKRLGIVMTQTNLQQFAYSNGLRKKISDMTEAEKVELRYMYVMEKTAEAQGNFKREQDGATAQMEIFKQGVKELGESFSEHILPIFTPVIKMVNDMIAKFSNLSDGTKKFIVTIAGVVAIAGPILLVLSSVFKAISNINNGIAAIPNIVGNVGKVGKAFSGLLDSTAFFGMAKWALIIIGVALAIGFLIKQINILIGRGKMAEESLPEIPGIQGMPGAMQGASARGYSVGQRYVDGSHLNGLDYVPYDGYIAELHKGEKVVTAEQNNTNSGKGDTFIIQVNMDEVDEVSKLVKVVNDLKMTKRAGFANG